MSDEKGSGNEQLESAKQAVSEIVEDLRARKLLLPAIILIVAIVAAFFVLPKSGDDQSVVSDLPTAPAVAQGPTAADRVATVNLVDIGEDPSGVALSKSTNPFSKPGDYSCTEVQAKNPRILDCIVPGNLRVQVICQGGQAKEVPCVDKSGSTGGGSSGSTGGVSETGDGDSAGGIYAFRVTVKYDDTQYSNIEQGGPVPPEGKGTKIATFENVSSTGAQASFRAVEGSIVSGVTVDQTTGLSFTMKKGETARITDPTAQEHTLRLVKITKVKIS
jgi:hypothetical protein